MVALGVYGQEEMQSEEGSQAIEGHHSGGLRRKAGKEEEDVSFLRFLKTQWNEKALGQTHSKRDGRKSNDDQTASPVKRKETDGFKAHRPLHTLHAPTDDWGPQRPQSDAVVSEPQTVAKSFTATSGFQGSDRGRETLFVQTAGTTFDFQGYSNAGESEFKAVLPVGLSRHEDADMGSGDRTMKRSEALCRTNGMVSFLGHRVARSVSSSFSLHTRVARKGTPRGWRATIKTVVEDSLLSMNAFGSFRRSAGSLSGPPVSIQTVVCAVSTETATDVEDDGVDGLAKSGTELIALPKTPACARSVGSVLDLKIEKVTNMGSGVARVKVLRVDGDGERGAAVEGDDAENTAEAPQGEFQWVVMIPFTIAGEKVHVEVTRVHKNFSEARVLKVLRPSPHRRSPLCKHFMQCEGCQYQHMTYEDQKKTKEQHIRDLLQYFLKIPQEEAAALVPPLITAAEPHEFGYRSKLTPHWDRPRKGNVTAIGFHRVVSASASAHRPPSLLSGSLTEEEEEAQGTEGTGRGVFQGKEAEKEKGEANNSAGNLEGGQQRREFDVTGRVRLERFDLEECPIALPSIQESLKPEKEKVRDMIKEAFRSQEEILEIESKGFSSSSEESGGEADSGGTEERERLKRKNKKLLKNGGTLLLRASEEGVITDCRAEGAETVLGRKFFFKAGEFFQNNPFALPKMIEFVVERASRPLKAPLITTTSSAAEEDESQVTKEGLPPSLLLDCYCGVGLFAVCAADRFSRVVGVEVQKSAVELAKRNRDAAGLKNCEFLCASAEDIFGFARREKGHEDEGDQEESADLEVEGEKQKDVQKERQGGVAENEGGEEDSEVFSDKQETLEVDPKSCVVILDPPRKGCDRLFLKQLFAFSPARVVYVSCNPATQARDALDFLSNGWRLECAQPVDLFPQTRHVENVMVFENCNPGVPSSNFESHAASSIIPEEVQPELVPAGGSGEKGLRLLSSEREKKKKRRWERKGSARRRRKKTASQG
uniref:TRAM domain-containing protein n=1 Tax=Chromera velia CCMP2878 TaxID=1169474 RepID=A0A0G4HDE8_9ALVE|eukprot:Cvel_6426.t1-p1 / transcript=Cvel_6426.t1 / gene=Cvel_6426 / organism=Chromera_velia_CCMP2878 / gene_product=tRNA (uracil(54)-C(5))-methyltransferase, putative / transcript_product=tRNA (uracil(54)-C(5))-methyltransferase, putative / location=Cvel_scaffold314:62841-69090(+) / protein_length=993 / sequence_SO=supercontig / SO=protein_coding / is_pseudo=false